MAAKLRVLAVDDCEVTRLLIGGILRKGGYDVTAVENGLVALELLVQPSQHFDVIILDRMMPEMDGMELLGRLKSDSELANIPVIMQTAADSEQNAVEAIGAGAFYYLAKPLKNDMVLAVVAAAVADAARDASLRGELNKRNTAIALLNQGSFRLQSLEEANNLAALLSGLSPHKRGIGLGLLELLLNAVEHGLLAISYAEKTELTAKGRWREEVSHRLKAIKHTDNYVEVKVQRQKNLIHITITDPGPGFDWKMRESAPAAGAQSFHGRGIKLARRCGFSSLTYKGRGNEVELTLAAPGEDD